MSSMWKLKQIGLATPTKNGRRAAKLTAAPGNGVSRRDLPIAATPARQPTVSGSTVSPFKATSAPPARSSADLDPKAIYAGRQAATQSAALLPQASAWAGAPTAPEIHPKAIYARRKAAIRGAARPTSINAKAGPKRTAPTIDAKAIYARRRAAQNVRVSALLERGQLGDS